MIKQLFAVLVFTFSSFFAFSQTAMFSEVVYTKDGNVFKGYIVEYVPNESIKIQLTPENIISIKFENIEKITREIKPNNDSETFGSGDYRIGGSALRKGYQNITEAYALTDFFLFGAGIHNVSAYQFNPYLSLGAGAGLENIDFDGFAIPAFVDFRLYWFDNKISPYINTKTGVSINLENSRYSEFLFNSTLGLKIDLEKSTMLFGFGYRSYDFSFGGTFNFGFIF